MILTVGSQPICRFSFFAAADQITFYPDQSDATTLWSLVQQEQAHWCMSDDAMIRQNIKCTEACYRQLKKKKDKSFSNLSLCDVEDELM